MSVDEKESDENLIILFKNGEQKAFKELVDRYTPSIFNFSARLVGRDYAPDVVQEVFIKIWKNISKYNASKASFKTWIFTIAKNSTTDYLRKKKNYVFSDLDDINNREDSFSQKIEDKDILPDIAMQKLEDKKILDESLSKLRPEYREVLVLHYQEEMTFDEIGKVLKKSPNTVKSQHRRALTELKDLLIE